MTTKKREQNRERQKRNEESLDLFFELKRKFVISSLFSSTLVLLLTFTSIYFLVANYIKNRPMEFSFSALERPVEINERFESDNIGGRVDDFLREKMREEREASLDALLRTLVVIGVGLEIMILFVAILLAEKSVQPVREAYENQKMFIANASHEMKTPLAVIQANLEAADIQDNHWINNAMKKVEDAVVLNNQLLMLARSETAPVVKKTEVDLGRLVRKTADFYAPKAKEKGVQITVFDFGIEKNKTKRSDSDSGKSVMKKPGKRMKKTLDRAGLEQVLNILIDNAVKYSETKIEIEVDEAGVKVRNDGAKIPPEEIVHVFERFYQTDKTAEGVGLGLAIAKSVAEINGWKIGVKSKEMVEFYVKV